MRGTQRRTIAGAVPGKLVRGVANATSLDHKRCRCSVVGDNRPESGDLAAAALGVGLESVFQPIVSLPDENLVGYEALARWPELGDLDPLAVISHATAAGQLDRLDQLCIRSAISTAISCALGPEVWLFVNCEPTTEYLARARDEVLALGHAELRLIFEVTERRLLTHPAAMLNKVSALRADGFLIALDDVDAGTDAMALIDVVAPDVVKLDLEVVQSRPHHDRLRTAAAILDYQQRTGALLLAEGIESPRHLEQALNLGAALGQGYRFGQPRRLDCERRTEHVIAPHLSPPQPVIDASTPFDLLASAGVEVCTERRDTLLALSRYLESQAAEATHPQIVLAAVQDAKRFTASTRRRYEEFAPKCPLVAVFGRGVAYDLGYGIRGVPLEPFDPLCKQWIVLTIGPGFATALVAREHDEVQRTQALDGDRRFDLAFTTERGKVAAAVRHLLCRLQ